MSQKGPVDRGPLKCLIFRIKKRARFFQNINSKCAEYRGLPFESKFSFVALFIRNPITPILFLRISSEYLHESTENVVLRRKFRDEHPPLDSLVGVSLPAFRVPRDATGGSRLCSRGDGAWENCDDHPLQRPVGWFVVERFSRAPRHDRRPEYRAMDDGSVSLIDGKVVANTHHRKAAAEVIARFPHAPRGIRWLECRARLCSLVV
ncbi:hypothetical protein TNCV_4686951 [Trichonephila clavipes]|nr:hypothetical protein TNCV_4686951 [Trichonephila clavipes]